MASTADNTNYDPSAFGGVQYDGQGLTLGEINNLYQRILGRDADAEGLAYWDKTNASYEALERSIANSDEATRAFLSKAQYDGQGPDLETINSLYRDILGRNADAGGLAAFDKANLTPEQIRREILKSDEYANKNPEAGKVRQLKKIVEWEKKKQAFDDYRPETDEGGQEVWTGRPRPEAPGEKPEGNKKELLMSLLSSGADLTDVYGQTYGDAVRLKQDLGQYTGKDASMIIPANPVGYSGGFRFDPVFGSEAYKEAALAIGKQLGLSEEQVRKSAGQLAVQNWYSDGNTKNIMGFSDYGKLLTDQILNTAGVNPAEANPEQLKPIYDAVSKVDTGLRQAGAVESQSSGFFKTIAADIVKNPLLLAGIAALTGGAAAGPLSTLAGTSTAIAGGAAAGATAGGIKGIAEGSFGDIAKGVIGGGLTGAAGGAALQGIGNLIGGQDFTSGMLTGDGFIGDVLGTTNPLYDLPIPDNVGLGFKAPQATIGAGEVGLGGLPEFDYGLPGSQQSPVVPGFNGGDLGTGLTPPAGFDIAPELGAGNLVTGVAPQIGDLFDGYEFPNQGLDAPEFTAGPDTGIGEMPTIDYGLGGAPAVPGFSAGDLGSGITPPTTPTIDFGSGLGTGLTATPPGGGTISQGGITNPDGSFTPFNPSDNLPDVSEGSGGTPGGGQPENPAGGGSGTGIGTGTAISAGKTLLDLLTSPGGLALLGGLGAAAGGSGQGQGLPGGQPVPFTPINVPMGQTPIRELQMASPYTEGFRVDPRVALNRDPLQFAKEGMDDRIRGYFKGGQVKARGIAGIKGFAQGRMVKGAGDGMSDDIPANIEGKEPVLLANEEYIIPAQAVSALGNGSSEAGSKVLDNMLERIYKAQTGKPKQMKPMNLGKVLPK